MRPPARKPAPPAKKPPAKPPAKRSEPEDPLQESVTNIESTIKDRDRDEAAEAKEAQKPEPIPTLRIFDRKHLWAWLHQAPDEVLRELYQTCMDRHGLSDLGCLLREYFTMRKYYPNNPLSASRCPFCKDH